MRKIYLLGLLLFTFFSLKTNAQVGSYVFSSSNGTYTEISGGSVFGTTTSDDQTFVDPASPTGSTSTGVGLVLGFNFTYNGIIFDRLGINNNGWISLGQSSLTPSVSMATSSAYTPLSSTATNTPAELRNRIAAFGRDLEAQTGSELRFETIGTAPNRVCVVQFKNYKRYSTAGTGDILNFQIRLNESNNSVSIVYGTVTFGTSATSTALAHIGLGGTISTDFNNRKTTAANDWNATVAGVTNTEGCQLPFTGTTITPPASGLTFTWTIPPPCTAPTTQPTGLVLTPTNSSVAGSFTAANPVADKYLVVRTTTNTPPVPDNATNYSVGNNAIGYIESASAATSWTSSGLLASTQYYFWVFSYSSFCSGGPIYLKTSPLTSSATTLAAGNITSTSLGGFWSSPATWVGGVVPGAVDNVTIADGAIVTFDAIVTTGSISVGQGASGILQWGATTYALTVQTNLVISNGARLFAHTTGGTGQTINIGGNFTNNGYANLSLTSTYININGSTQNSSTNQVIGGTGTFAGDGTKGIIRRLYFQTTGSSSISTTQNLITSDFAHTAGSLNTNGKLTIDNAPQVYGQALNMQVSNVAVTNMGTAYSNAPVVFGAAVSLWTAGSAAVLNTRYFSGNNVYLATTAGTFDGSTAPTHTSGSVTNGTVPLLWLGTLGTLGNPFIQTVTTVGTQYFYGNNLYVCTVAGIPSITSPPVHTTGAVVSGAATFLYVGSPATVSSNYDATSQTVRSLTLTSAGMGYSSAPAIAFSLNGGTVTTAATATAAFIQGVFGPVNSLTQKSGIATISGGITINSNQNATSFSGVGNMWTTSGGVNYTVAPTVGFAGPTAINLVTNGGSGYAAAPTITVTGGTLITGTALASSNFTITVANGQVVSVYLNTSTTATYSVPPTLAFSAGNATLAFPAGCWPAATAVIGSNGQLTNFTITNAGFGYVAAPTVAIGTTSATAAGGTFTTVATAPVCRIALYNLTYAFFTPALSNSINNDAAVIPANGKLNLITMNSASGAAIASNIELFSATPLTLTLGTLDMGGNTLTNSHYTYAGASGTTTASVSGRITLSSPGGSVTRTFPYDVPVVVATGTGSLATGSNVISLTSTRTAAPSGSVTGGTASVTGTRAYRIQSNASSVYGTAPTVTLNYNATDALTTVNNADLLITQAAALTGAWTVRSLSSGTGALSATGTRTTATSGVGPIVPTGDDYFAWATSLPCSGTPTTGVITGSSTACSGSSFTLSSSVFSTGNGMTYRWQSSTDNATWTNTTGVTPTSYSTSITSPTFFRRVDTCTNGNLFAISNVIQVTLNTVAYGSLPFVEGFENTWIDGCAPTGGRSIPTNNWRNTPVTTDSSWRREDDGASAGWNNVSSYSYTPSGSGSSLHSARFHGAQASSTRRGILDLYIDCSSGANTKQLTFDYINTSGNDSLRVSLSTDGGTSFTLLGNNNTISATWGSVTVPFTSSSATTIIRFTATADFGSTDIGLDNINVVTLTNCSGTPTAGTVTGPSSAICSGANFTVTATGYTTGQVGVTYRWQSSPNNSVWTNTTGTNPASFTTSVSSTTWFRLVDTCTNGNAFAVSNSVQVTVSAAAAVPYNQGFESITTDNTLPGCMAATSLGVQNLTYAATPSGTLYGRNPRSGSKFASFKWNPGAAGHWFFTDPIQLTGGQAYDAHVWYVTDGAAGFDALNIAYGTAANAASMGAAFATKANPINTTYANLMGTFTPPTTGVYIIGYQVTGISSTPWYVTIDDIAVVNTGVFPVTFTSFTGEKRGTNNFLNWTTSTEINNLGFELQRSADGVNFSPLEFVNSKAVNGNSNAALTYSFSDVKILNGTNYYRLKQIDKDGKFNYSSIVTIKGTKPTKLELTSIYPNPTSNTLNVVVSSPKGDKVTFIVSDITGKVISSQVMQVAVGDNNLPINVSNIAKGTYTIKAICADGCETATSKFVKQ